ncbi:MAG: hypothetical protein K8R13_03585 [Methanococcoides sp.]|nr:hypothetical protein [Methanococcoides sp.]
MKKAIMVLEDGTVIHGSGFGAVGEVYGELVVNTIGSRKSTQDDVLIRRTAIESNIPYITTISGFKAATKAMVKTTDHSFGVKPLQEYKVI